MEPVHRRFGLAALRQSAPPALLTAFAVALAAGGLGLASCSGGGGGSAAAARGLRFTNPGPGAGSFLWSIAVHPASAGTFYVGGDIEGPFKSTDGGATYARATGGLAATDRPSGVYAAQDIAIDPSNPDRLFLATWSGLYRSTDGGGAWSRILPVTLTSGATDGFSAIAVSPSDPDLILAGNGNSFENTEGTSTIYRSTSGGQSFSQATTPLAGTDTAIHAIVFDPVTPTAVYAATGEGILKSVDGGATFAFSNGGLPTGSGGAPIAHDLVATRDGSSVVLFATLRTQSTTTFDAGGVFRSTDGGASWVAITGDLPATDGAGKSYCYWRIAADPGDANKVFVGTRRPGWADDEMGLYRASNALASSGASVTWTYLWDPANHATTFADFGWLSPAWWNDLHVSFLAAATSGTSAVVYAGGDHIYKSADGGTTWTQAYADPAGTNAWTGRGLELLEIFDVAVDPNDARRWWIGYDDMGLWRTDDAGKTFVRTAPQQSPALFANTDCATSVVTDLSDSQTVYVGRNGGDGDAKNDWNAGAVFKTTNGGTSWTQLGAATLTAGRPVLLMLPGGTPAARTLLCATYGVGLFRSADSGGTWTAVDGAFAAADRTHVWTLARDPSNASLVYAGIADGALSGAPFDGGIYRSHDGGVNWSKLAGGTVPTGQVLGLAVASDGTMYAAATSSNGQLEAGTGTHRGGLYRSDDGGATWTRTLDQPRVDGVSVRPGDPTRVVAAVSSYWNEVAGNAPGVYISRDSGRTFARETAGVTHTFFWFIEYHPTDGDTIFAGSRGGGLFVGSGGGS